jgi:hypothetical protein
MERPITMLLPVTVFKILTDMPMTLEDLGVIQPETVNGIAMARDAYDSGDDIGLCVEEGQPVTQTSFGEFVSSQLHLWFHTHISRSVEAVKRGFYGCGSQKWANRYSAEDFHKGTTAPRTINWEEMQSSCRFQGYLPSDPSQKAELEKKHENHDFRQASRAARAV